MRLKRNSKWHPRASQMKKPVLDVGALCSRVKPFKFKAAERMLSSPTKHESVLAARIEKSRLRNWPVQRQVVMLGYILDFYFPTVGLCVEVDGGYHETAGQSQRDAVRDKALESYGVVTMRFGNVEVERSAAQVVKKIRLKLFAMAAQRFIKTRALDKKKRTSVKSA